MNTLDYVIETNGLSKAFGTIHALQPLDLKVARNSICGFLGPNGAGKTTMIKLLLGLAQPTGGSGRVFGKDLTFARKSHVSNRNSDLRLGRFRPKFGGFQRMLLRQHFTFRRLSHEHPSGCPAAAA
jgi:ABC-type branched-subunit amino acid transport system ATPase component